MNSQLREMLGNQYFMLRKYLAASREFEAALLRNNDNYPVMKKLIICYTQINRPAEAMSLFYQLISCDMEIIIKTDHVADDCPCPGLIGGVEAGALKYENKFIKNCMLGILWLYCDLSVSLRYLKQARDVEEGEKLLNKIITVYEDYLRLNPQ